MVVVFSDHGELMFRHGIFFDHHELYDLDADSLVTHGITLGKDWLR